MSYTNNTACQIRFGVWGEWKGKKSREKNMSGWSAGQARENLTDLHSVSTQLTLRRLSRVNTMFQK